MAGRHDFTSVADATRFHYQTEQEHAALTDGFAPDLAREQKRLAKTDLLVLVFPLWWGGPPAMLKGWFDRVLAYGVAYVDGRRFDTGLFQGRRALMAVTTGGTRERFSEGGAYGEIARVLYPVERLLLGYMGFEVPPPFVAYAAPARRSRRPRRLPRRVGGSGVSRGRRARRPCGRRSGGGPARSRRRWLADPLDLKG